MLFQPPLLAALPAELRSLARLRTPERVQDFVTALPINFETEGDTCRSVLTAIRRNGAHCIEGAFVAAFALWLAGERPLLMDMQADGDDDHVVTVFRRDGCWGAISKSNHLWLRWRDPIYRSLRELAMSYFHEYLFKDRKTLRRYSRAFDLARLDPARWVTQEDGCWDVAELLDESPHYPLITPAQARRLRRRDRFEVLGGRVTEYAAPDEEAVDRY